MPENLSLRVQLGRLAPADDAARAAIKRMKEGAIVQCDVRSPRNAAQHRLLFALLHLAAENSRTPDFDTPEKLLFALKIKTGHVDVWCDLDGKRHMRPKSIAFHNMDQSEFAKFFEAALAILASDLIGVDPELLRREVEISSGVKMEASA